MPPVIERQGHAVAPRLRAESRPNLRAGGGARGRNARGGRRASRRGRARRPRLRIRVPARPLRAPGLRFRVVVLHRQPLHRRPGATSASSSRSSARRERLTGRSRRPGDLDQAWLTHFTITDTRAGRFVVDERVNRAGPGIAGFDVDKRRIWNANWSIGVAAGRRGPANPGADGDEPGRGASPLARAPEAGGHPRPRRSQPQGGRRPGGRLPLPLVHPDGGHRDHLAIRGRGIRGRRTRLDGPRVLRGLPDGETRSVGTG